MKLPKSWNDVTIEQYYKLVSISNLFKDDIDRQVQLISLFSGQSVKDIEKLSVKKVTELCKAFKFIGELPSEKIHLKFKLNGNTYKPIILTKDMTASQFIDFSSVGKGCSGDEIIYHMHEIIACMCLKKKGNWFRPKWEYDGYDSVADDFLKMPMSVAYPYYVFFCNVLINLHQPIRDYSLNEMKKQTKAMRKLLS